MSWLMTASASLIETSGRALNRLGAYVLLLCFPSCWHARTAPLKPYNIQVVVPHSTVLAAYI